MKNYWILLLIATFISGCKQGTTKKFVKDISCYSDFSTVDWAELSNKYYRPNTADWDSTINMRITAGFPSEIASGYWHRLQNARTDFHQKSLPLRAGATKNVVKALDCAEAMFDTVFLRCVSQEYYMRLFPEMYNETMKPAIDKLVNELNNKLL